jgi:hypothetical protein
MMVWARLDAEKKRGDWFSSGRSYWPTSEDKVRFVYRREVDIGVERWAGKAAVLCFSVAITIANTGTAALTS